MTLPDQDTVANGLAHILIQVLKFIRRYVALTPPQFVAVTLWVTHTWVVEAFDVTPYLAVTSPEKRSGKTRLLEVLELLLRRPLRVSNISDAALFRSMSEDGQGRATLLLDEADAIFTVKGNREDLRSLLNAGYQRGAGVMRCEVNGKSIQVVRYDAFGPKVVAAIGSLPDTVADRSIPIRMRRRAPHEHVTRFRVRDAKAEAERIREALAAWATPSTVELLRAARPEIPPALNDRAQDGWEPLLAIADLIGGKWSPTARTAADTLHVDPLATEETVGIALLGAIRDVFAAGAKDRIPTAGLLKALVDRDDGPWADLWGKQVTNGDTKGPGYRLARLLKSYGICPGKTRIGMSTVRGYCLADLQDAFARYLPPEGPNDGTMA